MKHITIMLLGLWLGACASKPAQHWQAADADALGEWLLEGQLQARGPAGKARLAFSWQEVGETRTLTLHEKRVTTPALAIIEWQGDALRLRRASGDWLAGEAARAALTDWLGPLPPVDALSYWLRGLPAGADAQMYADEAGLLTHLEELDWSVALDDHSRFGRYQLPTDISLRQNSQRLDLTVQRVETGFVASWCETPAAEAGPVDVAAETDSWAPVWLDHATFCAQLARVHGGVVDPRAGLFGPDSMMWEINKPVTPAAMGAGTALLLQVSHPWITAGIDEHSDVRNDPLERARRTFSDMYAMIYGSLPTALATANKVHEIHVQIEGQMPYEAGNFDRHSEYRANEINAMIWVQATLWDTLVRMYEQVNRKLTDEEKARFYEETKLFAMLFGIPPEALPADWAAFQRYCREMVESDQLAVTGPSKALAETLFRRRNLLFWLLMPIQENITANNLPPRLRDEYGFSDSWWQRTSYKVWLFGGRVADRLTPGAISHNPAYNEAMARLAGKESGFVTRRMVKLVTHKDRLVN